MSVGLGLPVKQESAGQEEVRPRLTTAPRKALVVLPSGRPGQAGLVLCRAAMYCMTCVCSPAIDAEMADWVRLGGGNSGCCGNQAHTYGFHRAGNEVPASDYSRRHEAAAPYNMNWACAGDFGHSGNATLRAKHAEVLARLMRGELPMICEFIGMPWPGKPVYYWARWDGVTTLKRYTGTGHDTWSHISWWRSRANERAYLYASGGSTPTPAPTPSVMVAPRYPGYVLSYSPSRFDGNLKVWQERMRTRGWSITADGYFGDQTQTMVVKFQREKGVGTDGKIGPVTWPLPWTAPIT